MTKKNEYREQRKKKGGGAKRPWQPQAPWRSWIERNAHWDPF